MDSSRHHTTRTGTGGRLRGRLRGAARILGVMLVAGAAAALAVCGDGDGGGSGGAPRVGLTVKAFASLDDAGAPVTRWVAVWYPTDDEPRPYEYPSRTGTARRTTGLVAIDGRLAASGERYPVVVFSHGYGGCAFQSLMLTEELARRGYVVVAPDHRDHGCKIDPAEPAGRRSLDDLLPASFDTSRHRGRGHDLSRALDFVAASPPFAARIDTARVGAAGHSLGGYTALAVAGAIASWKDARVGAVLEWAGYLAPYFSAPALSAEARRADVPIMLAAFENDAIQSDAMGKAYAAAARPRFQLLLRPYGGRGAEAHLAFTNAICGAAPSAQLADCLALPEVAVYAEASFAFLDYYLRGAVETASVLRAGPSGPPVLRYDADGP